MIARIAGFQPTPANADSPVVVDPDAAAALASRHASIVAQEAIHGHRCLPHNSGVTFRTRSSWTSLPFLAC
jgi:hypothetical protein